MKLRYKTLVAALALATVAAVSAGIARSTSTEPIPDANGVIHACYKKPIGEVKIVYSAANCGPGQLPIHWSQNGGGDTYARSSGQSQVLPDDFSLAEIVRIDLPAGTYLVRAAGTVRNNTGGDPVIVSCNIETGAGTLLHSTLNSLERDEFGVSTQLATVELSAPDAVVSRCRSTASADVSAGWHLVAQRVGALK